MNDELARELIDTLKETNEILRTIAVVAEENGKAVWELAQGEISEALSDIATAAKGINHRAAVQAKRFED